MELILDIVYQILLRLSVKTLVRFQCVCKQWLSLISDPTFQHDHYSRGSQHDPLLLVTDFEFKVGSTKSDINSTIHLFTYNNQGNFIQKFSKNVVDLPPCMDYTVDYCQVLLCISPDNPEYSNRLLLCNPSTEELLSLPLAQEASKFAIGINYSVSTNELKLVRFFCRCHSDGYDEFLCEIFNPVTGVWREARGPPVNTFSFTLYVPFIHGAFHLLHNSMYNDVGGLMDYGIHVFDIESEEYTKITLPKYWYPVAASSIQAIELNEFGGSLCLSCFSKTTMELWFLKDYHAQEWAKEYTLDLYSLGTYVQVALINIMTDGRMLLATRKNENSGESLCCYNPQDKSVKLVREYKGGYMIPYVESFLSLGNLS